MNGTAATQTALFSIPLRRKLITKLEKKTASTCEIKEMWKCCMCLFPKQEDERKLIILAYCL